MTTQSHPLLQAVHPNGHPENGARGMNGRDLPAPLPQMPVNGWLGSPDSQQMQQMRSEGDPFHGHPPLVIDDKDGDCPHPPHHHNSGAVSDREHGGQLAPMEWSLSVCMLSTVNPCLQFILVQQGVFHFIILNLRLRCQSTGCNNTRHQALTQPSLTTKSQ